MVALTDRARTTIQDFGIAADRITVIPSGARASEHRPAVPERREAARESFGIGDELTVALVGALSEEKQPGLAVEAIAQIDGAHLLVAGDGPLRTEIATRGITDAPGRVHVLGALADPSPVYDAADVVVLPSRTEGLPGVLIEAGLRGPALCRDRRRLRQRHRGRRRDRRARTQR